MTRGIRIFGPFVKWSIFRGVGEGVKMKIFRKIWYGCPNQLILVLRVRIFMWILILKIMGGGKVENFVKRIQVHFWSFSYYWLFWFLTTSSSSRTNGLESFLLLPVEVLGWQKSNMIQNFSKSRNCYSFTEIVHENILYCPPLQASAKNSSFLWKPDLYNISWE